MVHDATLAENLTAGDRITRVRKQLAEANAEHATTIAELEDKLAHHADFNVEQDPGETISHKRQGRRSCLRK
jgi:hypothetical protein